MVRGGKAEPWRGKATYLDNNRLQKQWAKVCLHCTGVSGALFLRKSAKCGVVAARQGPGPAKHYTLQRKASKTLHKRMDGSVFGPRQRYGIAFLANFGEAGLGRRKAGLGRSSTKHFPEKRGKLGGTKASLDFTGASGSRFLRKTAKRVLGAVKQGLGAAHHCILAKKVKKHSKTACVQAS